MDLKDLIAALIALLIGGCSALNQNVQQAQQANPGNPAAALKQISITDLNVAATMADAATDSEHDVRAACWRALSAWIPSISSGLGGIGNISGGASAIEQAFEIQNKASGGVRGLVPKAVHIACAPVVLDAEATLAQLAAKLGVSVVAPGLPTPLP